MLLFAFLSVAFYAGTKSSIFAYSFQFQQSQGLQLTLQGNGDNVHEDFSSERVLNSDDHGKSHYLHRRRFFSAVISCIGCSVVDRSGLLKDSQANAADSGVIRSKGCYQGIGDGCTELSENNPLIQQLQQRSMNNRERNEKEALYAYYMKNYPDFFNTIGQVMIKKSSDNTFMVVTPEEVERLKKQGKLTYETPKTRGGTIVDLTQKPILVLKE